MVPTLDIESIVPQYGHPFVGKAIMNQFISWIENLECGIDLMAQNNYKVP
jgi:flavorubredoxin